MRTNNKGWDYCGNAQASVDGACQIILACDVTDATNDKEQAEPLAQATLATLAQAGIESPKNEAGAAQAIPATLDNGYYSEAAVQALARIIHQPQKSTREKVFDVRIILTATSSQAHPEPNTSLSGCPGAAQIGRPGVIRAHVILAARLGLQQHLALEPSALSMARTGPFGSDIRQQG
jgi:hypothetical protein